MEEEDDHNRKKMGDRDMGRKGGVGRRSPFVAAAEGGGN